MHSHTHYTWYECFDFYFAFFGGYSLFLFLLFIVALVLLLLLMVVLTRSLVRSFICLLLCLFEGICYAFHVKFLLFTVGTLCMRLADSCMYICKTHLYLNRMQAYVFFPFCWVCACVCVKQWSEHRLPLSVACVSCAWDFVIVYLSSSFSGKWMCFILAVFVLSTNNLYENFCENFVNSYVNDKVFEREIVCARECVWYVVGWKSSCKIKYPIKQARTTIMSATNSQKLFGPTPNEQWSEMQRGSHIKFRIRRLRK